MGAGKALKGAETVFLALLTIGLMGLLFLIIYGNLSGNLGFAQSSLTVTNESEEVTGIEIVHANATGFILNGTNYPDATGFTITTVWGSEGQSNGTGFVGAGTISGNAGGYNESIALANVSVGSDTGNISNASSVHYFPNISVSYTNSFKGVPERNTDSVIGNLTSGATQFFTFSNVWFILTAITILIGIVLGVIALVRTASGGSSFGGGKSRGRSEFTS